MNAPAVAAETRHSSSAATAVGTPGAGMPAAGMRLAVQPVILAGGSGTRLWPMSRERFPKQLIGLLGEHSLLQSTALRLDGLTADHPLNDDVLIVCGEDHRFTTAEQLRLTAKRATIMLEPLGRDTAPALTLAALRLVADGNDAVMTVMPADHAVADLPRFHAAVAAGVHCAAQGKIATMGIVPKHAETGYGYIRVGAPLGDAGTGTLDVRRLDRFVEKPHLELAQQYVASGEYWWNSGIFIVRASVWLKAIRQLEPAIYAACEQAVAQGRDDGDFFRVDRDAFAASPSNSIDYAVMEPLASQPQLCESVVVPLDAGWSDVGSWDAIWQISAKDETGNVGRGHVLFEGAESTFAHSESRLVACVGTQNLVVVETPDAVLVADKSRVQDVKKIVGHIKARQGTEATDHRKVHRPWGHYDSVDTGERFQVKRIVVKPGAQLSLQMHHHRAEHWIVVRGTARITRGDETFLLSENESTYIPLGVSHRLENPGKMPLELIEVQSGAYLGEDDIVRFDDTYGRQ
ncbi:TPA: mannose-1-phosphate guanylyltransferase/mannose-6-phosphate isomerase [Burkholderia cenocepacia]|uniref:mannose-1-phosphate guanylyltransferase/mannose-6-phosphate isomerase n=1 Tax=Burkholderia cenocepacia TaxID=95486 RepID=UPI000759D0F6|nr:mannose-1-phosphate guanylyltransferase/mannose-6-phosphate isomerase [Burkholderia cenocepacia]AOK37645.1 mannose-1-phosphate guanyltransferase [Burkholderia cenocepacia]KWF50020.1 mannose-1-phosphate guanyltransferase [Burkholderia cenocepacia]MBR7939367.1 mannose-1-phosphate guanylyltransferase/mannose-6-phosphate isomerase [Burkholderia cenocepacia]MBR8478795.1 mannose-1-phosphate guanylyltransferase/mannose-6-phosphate isomerase [Burkholderia cenocepacia]MDA3665167.1 mannose-1-phosphat